ncbi:AMP-binding protein [Phycicoccus avicenniae]|uniref:AMP-binding protein n=1 Tax=Phycicoccus avicenniae TaxID=2828860 RepID=UPI003D2BB5F9
MTTTADAPPGSVTLPWVTGPSRFADRPALHTPDGTLTHADLAERVATLADRLAGPRRLVQVEATTSVTGIVSLLAAQAAGHVVLLGAPGAAARDLRAVYDPDVVVGADGRVDERRAAPAHALHPDLALLLSTSGSTGAPKLVRLSAANLRANAEQIVEALGVREDDCAALTLPITYCYGLSVLTTHLTSGAAVMLSDRSVVDDGFWRDAATAGVTTIPGVPHTFELLERSGFAERDLPRLRCLTQAGGRMDPERVRRLAELGRRRGFDLVVMYGQSEATARMTVLPADLAGEHPDCVGAPVPGASIAIESGEIVFRGPNVMLGYAHGPDDLGLGREVTELRTGDLGELTPEGLLRITGRCSRFVKVLGHRIDLDALECRMRAAGHDVRCAGRDGLVVVGAPGAAPGASTEAVARAARVGCGAPRDAVRVVPVDAVPLLPNGKPDDAALLARAGEGVAAGVGGVGALYEELLGGPVPDDATFVGLGGDSLSYVEASIRLEELLGRLPAGWHTATVADLESMRPTVHAPPPADRRRWRSLPSIETSIWLRALSIVLIVGTHAHVFTLQGTANALLVLAGYQLARFQLSADEPRVRARRVVAAAVHVVMPSLVVIWGAHLLLGRYEVRNLFLANWLLGEPRLGAPWRFWFVEAVVLALVVVAALTRSAVVGRLDRRFPLGLPLALTLVAFVLFRVPWLPLPVPRMQGSALVVLHLFLLGWAVARAASTRQRLLVTGVVLGVVGTFSGNHVRDGLTIVVVLLVLWVPVSRVPRVLVPVVRVLAAASLYVYVVHWQALELLRPHPVAAFVGSLALGVAYWWLWTRPVTQVARSVVARVRSRRQRGLLDRVAPDRAVAPVLRPVDEGEQVGQVRRPDLVGGGGQRG